MMLTCLILYEHLDMLIIGQYLQININEIVYFALQSLRPKRIIITCSNVDNWHIQLLCFTSDEIFPTLPIDQLVY